MPITAGAFNTILGNALTAREMERPYYRPVIHDDLGIYTQEEIDRLMQQIMQPANNGFYLPNADPRYGRTFNYGDKHE